MGVGVRVIAWRGGCAARCLFVMIYYSLFADRSSAGNDRLLQYSWASVRSTYFQFNNTGPAT